MQGVYKIQLYASNQNKEGKHPVCLYLSKYGRTKRISLKIYASEKQWDERAGRFKKDKRLTPDYEKQNSLLTYYENRANNIYEALIKEETDWTLEQFEDEFRYRAERESVSEYFLKLIKKLRETNHFGNARNYETALEKLRASFPNFNKLLFADINLKFVKEFDLQMEKSGLCSNSRATQHSRLRAVLNKAIADKCASAKTFPYGKGKFNVNKLQTETAKRALDDETLDKFKSIKGLKYNTEVARRLFLFCYYAQGISFTDAARLTKSKIIKEDGISYIVYRREKTKNSKAKNIKIGISNNIQELLDWFSKNCMLVEDYLLPIVSVQGCEGIKLYNHIAHRLKRIGLNLKLYCGEIKAGSEITSYWSRHTFATKLLKSKEFDILDIKDAMGHKEIGTTQRYLAGLKDSELAKKIQDNL